MVQRPVLREHCELFRVAETRKVWHLSKASGEIARKTARSTGVYYWEARAKGYAIWGAELLELGSKAGHAS